MDYICYQYLYHSGESSRFLFGFLIPFAHEFDLPANNIKLTNNNIKLTNNISLEYRYINEDQYQQFVNPNIYDFSILGFIHTVSLGIKSKISSFFSQQRFGNPIFSSDKYINLWIEDYSSLPLDNLNAILDDLNQYCNPFFPKYSILNTPHSIPLGSFLIMENSTILQEEFVSTDHSFKPDDSNQFPFSIKFHSFLINNGYTARVKLFSVADDIMVNEIFSITEETKLFTLDNICPEQIIEIFDVEGNSIYDEHLTRIVEISLGMQVLDEGATLLKDKLSEKNPSLQKLPTNNILSTNTSSIVETDLKTEYNKSQRAIRATQKDPLLLKKENHAPRSFWFEKMSDPDAVSKITGLIGSAEKSYIFDPFFSSRIVKNKDRKNAIDDNAFLITNRLYGNVSIITSQNNSQDLINIAKSLFPIHKNRLSLSINTTNSNSLHDRYIVLENNSERTLYSLTNSLSSTMKDLPIGINEILGDAKSKALPYLDNILSKSNCVYSKTFDALSITQKNEWYEKLYIQPLLKEIPKDEEDYILRADTIPILKKNFNSSQDSISIKLLGIAEISLHILIDYHEFCEFFNSLIECHQDEISLEEITTFLINQKFYTPAPYLVVNLRIPNQLDISSYEKLYTWQRFPSRDYDIENNIPHSYARLLQQLYCIATEKLFEYFINTKHYSLQQIFMNIIAKSQIIEPLSMISSTSSPVKLLSLIKLLKPIQDMDEQTKKTILNSDIPKHLLCIILVSKSWENQKNKNFTQEYLDFINNFVDFDIQALTDEDNNYLSRYSEQLLQILPRLNNFNLELSKKVIKFYLNKEQSICHTLTSNSDVLNSLLVLISKITENDKGRFLKTLVNSVDLNTKYTLVTSPLSQKLFSYNVFAVKNRIVQIMLYIFARSSDNEKVLENTLDKIIHSLSLSLERKYSPYINLNFLLLHGFFSIILSNEKLVTPKYNKLLEYLRKTDPFSIFYNLYNRADLKSLFHQIKALIEYIHQYSDDSTYSNDKQFITIHACEIILLLSSRYLSEVDQNKLETYIETTVNQIFTGIFSISFNKEVADDR
ncbi:MAG: hypothetical protein ACRCV0_04705 [Brevinema sp.]